MCIAAMVPYTHSKVSHHLATHWQPDTVVMARALLQRCSTRATAAQCQTYAGWGHAGSAAAPTWPHVMLWAACTSGLQLLLLPSSFSGSPAATVRGSLPPSRAQHKQAQQVTCICTGLVFVFNPRADTEAVHNIGFVRGLSQNTCVNQLNLH